MVEATQAQQKRLIRFVFDLGNTRVKSAVFEAGVRIDVSAHPLHTGFQAIREAFKMLDHFKDCQSTIAVSSVNPIAEARLTAELASRNRSIDLLLNSGADLFQGTQLKHKLANPNTVGVDRVLGCLGAWRRTNDAVIVVDCGTATTVNVMNQAGVFHGGAIAPGRPLMSKSLFAGTAQLPDVLPDRLETPIGDSTERAIASGVSAWMIGGTSHALTTFQNAEPSACIFLTGGDAPLLSPHLSMKHEVEPWLVLEGLDWIASQWQNQST